MTITQTDSERPDVTDMYVVHRVFRRELVNLPVLVRGVPDGDAARAAVVGDALTLVLDGLHMHHTGEDVVLWPILLQRATLSADLLRTMQDQHVLVDSHLDQIGPLTAEWVRTGSAVRGEQLARLVDDLRGSLLAHLDLEEREVLPLVVQHLTVAEWHSVGQHGQEVMTKQQLPLMFGAVLEDASPEERALMLGALPWPVRVVMRTWGVRHYRRYITRVRGR